MFYTAHCWLELKKLVEELPQEWMGAWKYDQKCLGIKDYTNLSGPLLAEKND